MTVLSVLVGWAAPNLVRKLIAQIQYLILACLFTLPGRAGTSSKFNRIFLCACVVDFNFAYAI